MCFSISFLAQFAISSFTIPRASSCESTHLAASFFPSSESRLNDAIAALYSGACLLMLPAKSPKLFPYCWLRVIKMLYALRSGLNEFNIYPGILLKSFHVASNSSFVPLAILSRILIVSLYSDSVIFPSSYCFSISIDASMALVFTDSI